MKANFRLGGILAVTGALLGILGHAVLFLNWYQTGMAAESRGFCETISFEFGRKFRSNSSRPSRPSNGSFSGAADSSHEDQVLGETG